MDNMFTYKYGRANLATDLVVIAFHEGKLLVLIKWNDHLDGYTLPGKIMHCSSVPGNEFGSGNWTLEETVRQSLIIEGGGTKNPKDVTIDLTEYLKYKNGPWPIQLDARSDIERDHRYRCVTIPYLVLVGSEAVKKLPRKNDFEWVELSQIEGVEMGKTIETPDALETTLERRKISNESIKTTEAKELYTLKLDHIDILNHAIERIRFVASLIPIGREILPDTFTMSDLQRLYEAVFCSDGTTFDRVAFQKLMLKRKHLCPAGEKPSHGKAARLYSFDDEVYDYYVATHSFYFKS